MRREPKGSPALPAGSRSDQRLEIADTFAEGLRRARRLVGVADGFAPSALFSTATKRFTQKASLPSRGRGSKQVEITGQGFRLMSLPSRGRGSKLARDHPAAQGAPVAPFAGAWIETPHSEFVTAAKLSLPSRGRGSTPPALRKPRLDVARQSSRQGAGLVEFHLLKSPEA